MRLPFWLLTADFHIPQGYQGRSPCLVGGVCSRAQTRANLPEQLPQPRGIAWRAAETRLHIKTGEFLDRWSKLRHVHGCGKFEGCLRFLPQQSAPRQNSQQFAIELRSQLGSQAGFEALWRIAENSG